MAKSQIKPWEPPYPYKSVQWEWQWGDGKGCYKPATRQIIILHKGPKKWDWICMCEHCKPENCERWAGEGSLKTCVSQARQHVQEFHGVEDRWNDRDVKVKIPKV